MYNPYDYYFKKAKKTGYKARSAFKLEEIDKKFGIFDANTKKVVDIWCSPWSWIQYAYQKMSSGQEEDFVIIGFDLNPTNISYPGCYVFQQDATDYETVSGIIKEYAGEELDLIISDLAPNTTWIKDIDAIKSIQSIEKTLPVFENFLKDNGKFVIKVFMWPDFEDFLGDLKKKYWGKRIKTYKPSSTRKHSKEIYVVKTS